MPSLAPERRVVRVETRFLRVPGSEWAEIAHGEKTEVRHHVGYAAWLVRDAVPPEPIIAYSVLHSGRREKLMVLEQTWTEPLGSISPDSLRREGCENFADFRVAWKRRFNRGRWNPLNNVGVFRLRPWADEDAADFGERLLRRLYLDVVRER